MTLPFGLKLTIFCSGFGFFLGFLPFLILITTRNTFGMENWTYFWGVGLLVIGIGLGISISMYFVGLMFKEKKPQRFDKKVKPIE